MKYNIIAWLLAFQGEIEAADDENLETKVKAMCNYPSAAPIIIQHVEEIEEHKEPEPQAKTSL